MKYLKLSILMLSIVITTNIVNAQCYVNFFSFPDPPNGIVFISNELTGMFASDNWDFGDGDSLSYFTGGAAGSQVTHSYAMNGTYYVCVTFYDSLVDAFGNPTGGVGCTATFCDSVLVTTAGLGCNLTAIASSIDNGNGNFTFSSSITGANVYNNWSFGDGSFGQGDIVNHNYISNGTFAASLGVSDNTIISCTYTDTTIVSVSGVVSPVACMAAYVSIYDSLFNEIYVFNNSIGNNLTYFWDFGDGNTSNQQFPNYTYSTSGSFWLCLTVDDGNGCFDTFCDSIGPNGMVVKQDGFTIQVVSPIITGIVNNNNDRTVLVYPNPSKDHIHILNDNLSIERVSIIDLNGKIIYNNKYSSSIDISYLSKGIYFLKLETKNKEELHYKFIKE